MTKINCNCYLFFLFFYMKKSVIKKMHNFNYYFAYLQRGTLHVSWLQQIQEWSLNSFHIDLQHLHPPSSLLLHVVKCLINPCKAWHVENLVHGLPVISRSYDATLVQPSVHICSKHCTASLNCTNNFCSSLCLFPLFFLCFTQSPTYLRNI